VADEEALAACWAWEQFYLGMTITGTVYNELRLASPGPRRRAGWGWRGFRSRALPGRPAVRQHEPSGGGRSIPQHRRMYAQARAPRRVAPVEQRTEDGFRRTWLRRAPADVAAAGRRLGADAAETTREDVEVYPAPSAANCPPCPYFEPCRALQAGRDAQPIVLSRYRKRPALVPQEGRLGGRAWGLGRGAAPPRFRRGQDG